MYRMIEVTVPAGPPVTAEMLGAALAAPGRQLAAWSRRLAAQLAETR